MIDDVTLHSIQWCNDDITHKTHKTYMKKHIHHLWCRLPGKVTRTQTLTVTFPSTLAWTNTGLTKFKSVQFGCITQTLFQQIKSMLILRGPRNLTGDLFSCQTSKRCGYLRKSINVSPKIREKSQNLSDLFLRIKWFHVLHTRYLVWIGTMKTWTNCVPHKCHRRLGKFTFLQFQSQASFAHC